MFGPALASPPFASTHSPAVDEAFGILLLVAKFAGYALLFVLARRFPYWQCRWALARQTAGYRRKSSAWVEFRYPPGFLSNERAARLLRACERELHELTYRFGFPLQLPVLVVLFASPKPLERLAGRPAAGLAWPWGNAVGVTWSGFVETVRHELAHLFSAEWGDLDPPLKSEGLAVIMQGREWDRPIDLAARDFLGDRSLTLPAMLRPRFFRTREREHACYVLAGSFTGFLIRRYGWWTYRRFFQRANRRNFESCFLKTFGITLPQAEVSWRQELRLRGAGVLVPWPGAAGGRYGPVPAGVR